MTELTVRGLHVSVGGAPLLRGIDLLVRANELHVLLGPSGCGKTTLLRAIAGLHPIEQGEILLDGERVDTIPPEARGIVLLHQEDTLFPHLSVAGNIGFSLRVRGQGRAAMQSRTRELLALVGLEGFETRSVSTLSGGERQRVALARTLAARPRVLLLDEPFSALDRGLRQTLREDVRSILHQSDVTTLFVTHDRDEALSLADELVLLADGGIADHGPPARIFERPSTLAAARVLGRRNLFHYRREGDVLQTSMGPVAAAGDEPEEGTLLVNEESITLGPGSPASATVAAAEYLGTRTSYRVRHGDATIICEQAGPPRFVVGDAVEARWDPRRHVAFPDTGKTPQS